MTENIEKCVSFCVVDKGQKAMWQEPEDPLYFSRTVCGRTDTGWDRAARRLIYVLIKKSPSYLRESGSRLPNGDDDTGDLYRRGDERFKKDTLDP